MSGDAMANIDLSTVVSALTNTISGSDIVTFFATGVSVALPIILTWFGCKWVYRRFVNAVKGGRG